MECPQVIVDFVFDHVLPANGEDVYLTFTKPDVEMTYLDIYRHGEHVDFTLCKEDEATLRRYFGFTTEQLEGKDVVTGFLVQDETDETVRLRLRRPQVINQVL